MIYSNANIGIYIYENMLYVIFEHYNKFEIRLKLSIYIYFVECLILLIYG